MYQGARRRVNQQTKPEDLFFNEAQINAPPSSKGGQAQEHDTGGEEGAGAADSRAHARGAYALAVASPANHMGPFVRGRFAERVITREAG